MWLAISKCPLEKNLHANLKAELYTVYTYNYGHLHCWLHVWAYLSKNHTFPGADSNVDVVDDHSLATSGRTESALAVPNHVGTIEAVGAHCAIVERCDGHNISDASTGGHGGSMTEVSHQYGVVVLLCCGVQESDDLVELLEVAGQRWLFLRDWCRVMLIFDG